MPYVMIAIAVIMFSFQFVFNEGFKKQEGSTLNASLKFALYTSLSGIIVLLIVNKAHLEISLFSVLTALVYSIICVALSYCSIMAFKYANLSVYSVFCMIGGMLLPFLYGIMTGEELTIVKVVCLILIALSVLMSVKKEEESKKAFKYYIMVFILNGLVGVVSKFHQSYPTICVDSGSFMMLTKIITVLIALILLVTNKDKDFCITKQSVFYCSIYSVLNSVGNLLLLIALLSLPASIQYPMVTGGVIICSTLIVILRREKLTKKELASALIAFVATRFMAI